MLAGSWHSVLFISPIYPIFSHFYEHFTSLSPPQHQHKEITLQLEKAGSHKSAKPPPRKNPASSGKQTRRDLMKTKNLVSLALLVWHGITAGKTQHGLCTQQRRYCSLSEDRHRHCDLTFVLPTPK